MGRSKGLLVVFRVDHGLIQVVFVLLIISALSFILIILLLIFGHFLSHTVFFVQNLKSARFSSPGLDLARRAELTRPSSACLVSSVLLYSPANLLIRIAGKARLSTSLMLLLLSF